MELWKPTGISFSAGGEHIIALLGALSRLIETGTSHNVTRWYGCSAGSFCAYVGALGVSPLWIRDVVTYFDTRVIAELEEDSVADFMNCWGLNSGSEIRKLIGRFLDTWESGASNWTFAHLSRKRPGISLFITATNLTMGSLSVFSTDTTPDMKILDAIRASLSVPLLFTPWKSPQGDIFCDGAIMEYFPWSCVKDKAHTLVIACSDTGICHRKLVKKNIKSIEEYIDRIFKLVQQNQCSDDPRYWIAINNTSVDALDFKIEKEVSWVQI
jgi:predicted acylesterase/phospholipase RssA